MKLDRFTKIVLTVIAVNLTIMTVKDLDLISNAYAGNSDNHLKKMSTDNYLIVPIDEDGAIRVKLSAAEEISVNISGISTWDKLNVNLEEIGGGFISNGGPIPVRIKE